MAQRIGVIGLEGIGHTIATKLSTHAKLKAPLVVFNRTTKEAEDFAFQHANSRATSALTNVVRNADIIWTCLPDEQECEAVYQVLLASEVRGRVFVVVNELYETASLESVKFIDPLATKVEERGALIAYVHVVGQRGLEAKGPPGCTLSGKAAAIERVMPFVQDLFINITIASMDFTSLNRHDSAKVGHT